MNLFTYLLSKKGKNSLVHKGDLFAYLLGKQTPKEVKTATGTTISITDATKAKIVSLTLSKESSQDGTPTPENPVEIKTVKGYRNVFDKENVDWYRNNVSSFSATSDTSTTRIRTTSFGIIGNKTYTISGIPSGISLISIRQFDNNQISLGNATLQDNTFTLDENCYYIHLLFGGENFTSETNTLMKDANIQIVEGEEELPYVPYGTNWIYTKVSNGTDTNYYTIPLNDNEILGIGDYKDELIVDKNGHCWLNKKTGKVVLDGSESAWSKSGNTTVDRYNYNTSLYLANNSSLCNYFKTGNTNNTNINEWFNNQGAQLCFNYSTPGTTTLQEWKTWLSTHNLVLYQPLVAENLIDLNYDVDIRLFKGTNTITNSDDMNMTLKYY